MVLKNEEDNKWYVSPGYIAFSGNGVDIIFKEKYCGNCSMDVPLREISDLEKIAIYAIG